MSREVERFAPALIAKKPEGWVNLVNDNSLQLNSNETFSALTYGSGGHLFVGTSRGNILGYKVREEEEENGGSSQKRLIDGSSPNANGGNSNTSDSPQSDKSGAAAATLAASISLLASRKLSPAPVPFLTCAETKNLPQRLFALCDSVIYIIPADLTSAGTILAKNALCFGLQVNTGVGGENNNGGAGGRRGSESNMETDYFAGQGSVNQNKQNQTLRNSRNVEERTNVNVLANAINRSEGYFGDGGRDGGSGKDGRNRGGDNDNGSRNREDYETRNIHGIFSNPDLAPPCEANICVCSRKKLHLFRPLNNTVTAGPTPGSSPNASPGKDRGGDSAGSSPKPAFKYEMYREIEMDRHNPLMCRWINDSIILGYNKEYVLVSQEDGSVKQIFCLDGTTFPKIISLPFDEIMLFYQDRVGLFFNLHTKQPSPRNTLEWNRPQQLVVSANPRPYLVGVSDGGEMNRRMLVKYEKCGPNLESERLSVDQISFEASATFDVFSVRDQTKVQCTSLFRGLYEELAGASSGNSSTDANNPNISNQSNDDLFAEQAQLLTTLSCSSDNNRRLFIATKTAILSVEPIPFEVQLNNMLQTVSDVPAALELLVATFGNPEDEMVDGGNSASGVDVNDDSRRGSRDSSRSQSRNQIKKKLKPLSKREIELRKFHRKAGWLFFGSLEFLQAFQHFAYGDFTEWPRLLSYWNDLLPPTLRFTDQNIQQDPSSSKQDSDTANANKKVPPVETLTQMVNRVVAEKEKAWKMNGGNGNAAKDKSRRRDYFDASEEIDDALFNASESMTRFLMKFGQTKDDTHINKVDKNELALAKDGGNESSINKESSIKKAQEMILLRLLVEGCSKRKLADVYKYVQSGGLPVGQDAINAAQLMAKEGNFKSGGGRKLLLTGRKSSNAANNSPSEADTGPVIPAKALFCELHPALKNLPEVGINVRDAAACYPDDADAWFDQVDTLDVKLGDFEEGNNSGNSANSGTSANRGTNRMNANTNTNANGMVSSANVSSTLTTSSAFLRAKPDLWACLLRKERKIEHALSVLATLGSSFLAGSEGLNVIIKKLEKEEAEKRAKQGNSNSIGDSTGNNTASEVDENSKRGGTMSGKDSGSQSGVGSGSGKPREKKKKATPLQKKTRIRDHYIELMRVFANDIADILIDLVEGKISVRNSGDSELSGNQSSGAGAACGASGVERNLDGGASGNNNMMNPGDISNTSSLLASQQGLIEKETKKRNAISDENNALSACLHLYIPILMLLHPDAALRVFTEPSQRRFLQREVLKPSSILKLLGGSGEFGGVGEGATGVDDVNAIGAKEADAQSAALSLPANFGPKADANGASAAFCKVPPSTVTLICSKYMENLICKEGYSDPQMVRNLVLHYVDADRAIFEEILDKVRAEMGLRPMSAVTATEGKLEAISDGKLEGNSASSLDTNPIDHLQTRTVSQLKDETDQLLQHTAFLESVSRFKSSGAFAKMLTSAGLGLDAEEIKIILTKLIPKVHDLERCALLRRLAASGVGLGSWGLNPGFNTATQTNPSPISPGMNSNSISPGINSALAGSPTPIDGFASNNLNNNSQYPDSFGQNAEFFVSPEEHAIQLHQESLQLLISNGLLEQAERYCHAADGRRLPFEGFFNVKEPKGSGEEEDGDIGDGDRSGGRDRSGSRTGSWSDNRRTDDRKYSRGNSLSEDDHGLNFPRSRSSSKESHTGRNDRNGRNTDATNLPSHTTAFLGRKIHLRPTLTEDEAGRISPYGRRLFYVMLEILFGTQSTSKMLGDGSASAGEGGNRNSMFHAIETFLSENGIGGCYVSPCVAMLDASGNSSSNSHSNVTTTSLVLNGRNSRSFRLLKQRDNLLKSELAEIETRIRKLRTASSGMPEFPSTKANTNINTNPNANRFNSNPQAASQNQNQIQNPRAQKLQLDFLSAQEAVLREQRNLVDAQEKFLLHQQKRHSEKHSLHFLKIYGLVLDDIDAVLDILPDDTSLSFRGSHSTTGRSGSGGSGVLRLTSGNDVNNNLITNASISASDSSFSLGSQYLRPSFLRKTHQQRQRKVEERLASAAYLSVYQRWFRERSKSVTVTPERCCPVCHKRIPDKAFAADCTTGVVTHIQCAGGGG